MRLRKVAIGLLALDRFQLHRQLQHETLHFWVVTDTIFHNLYQLQHRFPGLAHQFVTGCRLLLVEVQQFLLENIIGELGLDLPDVLSGQARLPRLRRPRHHMDMGMIPFVVKGGVPPEVTGWDVHRRGDVVAVSPEEITPRLGVVVYTANGKGLGLPYNRPLMDEDDLPYYCLRDVLPRWAG